MEYLVMECHDSYAVVLDSRGRFLKVANLHYTVGQELMTVVPMEEPRREVIRWRPVLSMAACLCIVCVGLWQMVLMTMGTVLIQINPQVRLSVNRMERVITAEAVNADGAKLLFDYHPFGKTVEQVTEELTDRAAQMGYLTDGGEVHLTVDSQDAQWKTETENRLKAVIVHDARNITIIIEHGDLEDLEDLVDELEDILEDDDDNDDDDHSDEHHDDDDDDDDDEHHDDDDDDDDHHEDDDDDDDDDNHHDDDDD